MHENSVFLVDNFIENKPVQENGKRYTRINAYEIGQSEEVKYLDKWPAVFLPVSCLASLEFDMKVMFGSFLVFMAFVMLLIWNVWALRKFQTANKSY